MASTPGAGNDRLSRIASLPFGAGVGDLAVGPDNRLLITVARPSGGNPQPFARASVGLVQGIGIDDFGRGNQADWQPEPAAETPFQLAAGRFEILLQEQDFRSTIPGGLGAVSSAASRVPILFSRDPVFARMWPRAQQDSEFHLITVWSGRPGGISSVRLRYLDGRWMVVNGEAVMLSLAREGGLVPGEQGIETPWSSFLIGERLPPFAQSDGAGSDPLAELTGASPNRYAYGSAIEFPDPTDPSLFVRRSALGRFDHGGLVLLPDRRTLFMTDRSPGGALYRFVADEPGDLSSGTLSVARLLQDGALGVSLLQMQDGPDPASPLVGRVQIKPPADPGFTVEWIDLGGAHQDDVDAWSEAYGPNPDNGAASGTIGEEEIAIWALDGAADARVAFLETPRAALAKGGTVELSGAEALAFEPGDDGAGALILALSTIDGAMADRAGDVRLKENPCGALYRLPIEADGRITRMEPWLKGGPFDQNAQLDACALDAVATPRSLLVLEDGGLMIGEGSVHRNNAFVWTYRADDG